MLKKNSLLLLLLFIILSCNNNDSPEKETFIISDIKGVVQKGPFTSGSSITIQELGINLSPNGTTYQTVTNDDFGSYSLNSSIKSEYIEVITQGFYFNEVSGKLSSANLTLRSLIKVEEKLTSNINILTTLAKDRIVYLINEENLTFDEAKTKAKKEVLSIFKITDTNNISDFARMDLSKDTDSDAILIAISSILQGDNSVAELSELISKIILDIKTDGILDNLEIINELKKNSENLNLFKIRANLENRYNSLGLKILIPNFEKYATRLFPLAILSTTPKNNDIEVTSNSVILKINKPINHNTVSKNSLVVKTENTVIEGTFEYKSNNSYEIIFTPTNNFKSSKKISVLVNNNLKGIDLTYLKSNYTFSFTTGSNDIISGLTNYYTFNNNTNDYSGNDRHVIPPSTNVIYSSDISGNNNSALFFKGDKTSIDIPRAFNPTNTEWTYSVWFKLDRVPSQSTNGGDIADFYLLTRKDFDYISDCYLRIDDGDDIIRTTIDHGNNKVTSNVKVTTNTWYHVVMSNSSDTISIYVNGELKVTSNFRFKSTFSNNEPFRINWSYGQVDNLSGSIDNVRLYQRSLNSNEVKKLYDIEKN